MSNSNSFFNYVCIFASVYLIYWGASTQGKITQAINNSTKNDSGNIVFKDDNGTPYTQGEILALRIISIIALIFGASTFLSSNGPFAITLDNWGGPSTLQYPTGIKAVFGVLLISIIVIILIISIIHKENTEAYVAGIAVFLTAFASIFQYINGETVFVQGTKVTEAFENLAETHGLTRRQRSELNSCLHKQKKLKESLDKKTDGINKISKGFLSVDGKQDLVDTGRSKDDLVKENERLSADLQQKSKKLEKLEGDYGEDDDDYEFDLDGDELGFENEEE
tara:strand:+ start:1067 stop:1906 length:840 start_codon:yes stop_codon:yes gene_type:complete